MLSNTCLNNYHVNSSNFINDARESGDSKVTLIWRHLQSLPLFKSRSPQKFNLDVDTNLLRFLI